MTGVLEPLSAYRPFDAKREREQTQVSQLLLRSNRVEDIRLQGGVGDGKTDNSDALRRALDSLRRSGGGTLFIPGGAVWNYGSGYSAQEFYWDVDDGWLTISALGGRLAYQGSGTQFLIKSTTGNNTTYWAQVFGGHWQGTSAATDGIRIEDQGFTRLINCVIGNGGTAGTGYASIRLRNVNSYCERTEILQCRCGGDYAVNLEPASVTGGAKGTESFARTVIRDLELTGGTPGVPLVNCRGGFYDGKIDGLRGNIDKNAHVLGLAGVMGGTYIENIAVENSNGNSTTGAYYSWGAFTGLGPVIRGVVPRNNRNTDTGSTPTYGTDGFRSPVNFNNNVTQTQGAGLTFTTSFLSAENFDNIVLVSGKSISGAANFFMTLSARKNAFASSPNDPILYQSDGSGGTEPFDVFGNFVIQGAVRGGNNRGIYFKTGTDSTYALKVGPNGSVVVGSAALATNATAGFLYLPTSAGTPVGTPGTNTGSVASEYDTTNNNLMVYNGAWKTIPSSASAASFASLTVVGAFGCNGATAQTAFASGGAAGAVSGTATLAGYGFASAAEFNAAITAINAIRTLANNERSALVADGIMS